MSNVAKTIEISSDSRESFEDAVKQGIQRAGSSIDNVQSAWIKEQKVLLKPDGSINTFRVHMQVTFALNN